MNQHRNPAWQGAVQVASIRLKTIDEALAKLEAVVPDADGNIPQSSRPTPDEGPSTSYQPPARSRQLSNNQPYKPAPIPDSSQRALESFIAGAA